MSEQEKVPPVMGRMDHDLNHRWHVALNRGSALADFRSWSFMYEAKNAAEELPRLALLFRLEREGKLATAMRSCSHSEPVAVPENHLACCLGTVCRECPFLRALDAAELSDAERDYAKAWTCVTHIIASGGDTAREGYIMTVDDRMFWDNLYASLAGGDTGGMEDGAGGMEDDEDGMEGDDDAF